MTQDKIVGPRETASLLLRQPQGATESDRPVRVLVLSRRDAANPDAGGSEEYLEEIGAALVARGAEVTVFAASFPGAARRTVHRGMRIVRRGGSVSVFLWALAYHALGRLGSHDIVVDVQNGLPFLSVLYCRHPVVLLIHHLHTQEWPLFFNKWIAGAGWWIESRLSPRLYRRCPYVTVSNATADELVGLGVDARRISLVQNGVHFPLVVKADKTDYPSLCVLGRLVPQKRVEVALEAVAILRRRLPGLRVTVVGRGPLEQLLRAAARDLRVDDAVEFTGWVDEARRDEILARSWALAMPSLKEGWGLAVLEAAAQGTPAVAFMGAGGLDESILNGVTGLLANDRADFVASLGRILDDRELRTMLGEKARTLAETLSWSACGQSFAEVLGWARAYHERPDGFERIPDKDSTHIGAGG